MARVHMLVGILKCDTNAVCINASECSFSLQTIYQSVDNVEIVLVEIPQPLFSSSRRNKNSRCRIDERQTAQSPCEHSVVEYCSNS